MIGSLTRMPAARMLALIVLPVLAATGLVAGLLTAPASAIVGGQPVAAGTWPWIARVVITTPTGVGLCSGSVVAPNVVLTAAHCAVDPATMTAYPSADFSVMTGSVSTLSGGQTSGVSQVVPYPYYEKFTGTNGTYGDRDLALLQLSEPTTAPPIKLATTTNDASLYLAGTGGQVAGWGATSGLSSLAPLTPQWANTVVQSTTYCDDQANSVFHAIFDSVAQLCAIDAPTDSSATCEGDSGGPLVASEPDGTPVEIGITNWGQAQCSTTTPDFFSKVAWASSWLSSELQALSPSIASTTTVAAPTAPPSANPPVPPTVTTAAATDATTTALTLAGSVNPNGTATTYYFQWGPTAKYGHRTPSMGTNSGRTLLPVAYRLAGLSPGEKIYYRMVAVNANGTTVGERKQAVTVHLLPEWGTYRGEGRRMTNISFNVAKNGRQIKKLAFGFTLSCTNHRGRLSYEIKPSGTYRLTARDGLGLATTFYDKEDWKYSLDLRLTTNGRASGTVRVRGRKPGYGMCDSGLLRWTAD